MSFFLKSNFQWIILFGIAMNLDVLANEDGFYVGT